MFEVTDSAVNNLKAYLEQNKISSAVRIALMQGGWSGPSLGLALDEPKESDKIFEEGGLQFLVEESLLEKCGSVKVDFMDAGYRSGFSITATNPLGGGGSCSSGSCGGGSCGWQIFYQVFSNLPPYRPHRQGGFYFNYISSSVHMGAKILTPIVSFLLFLADEPTSILFKKY